MKISRLALVAALLALGGAAAGFWVRSRTHADSGLTLYGNLDLREVDLAFDGGERIAAVLVQEGDRVHRGEVLARMDTARLEPQVREAEAAAAAEQAVVDRLHHGSRPEEIAQARANALAAQADADNLRRQYGRLQALWNRSGGRAVGRQDLDSAQSAMDVAEARLEVERKALDLALAGPRREDVAEAEAQLQADHARADLLRQELADAQLIAPMDAVVRSRLMEPGELASPSRPVLSLAIMNPKWVRAYASEPDLARLRPGQAATVTVDGFPGRRFAGWIGFISPVAEFTPKTVETTELRTSLVYEVRVFVRDPSDVLRLGMPATVQVAAVGS